MRVILALFFGLCVLPARAGDVQEQWTWWGPTISGATGQNYLWNSGPLPPSPPSWLKQIVFPSDWPRQFKISFVRAVHQGGATGGQFAILKDPGCVYFNTGHASGYYQDGDHTHIHTLASVWFNRANEPPERNIRWDPPVFFDQDVDCLRVQLGIFGTDMANFQLGILRPDPLP